MGNQNIHIPIEEIIDLYAGAGGTSLGFENAKVNGLKICNVIACVNHDPTAIKSHAANFPHCLHVTEDVRLVNVASLPRKSSPCNILTLWASLECTEYSKAKNSAKDPEGRTLALDLLRYVDELQPEYIKIENVQEFQSWGDLDVSGRPIKRKNGRFYLKWVQAICDRGYRYDFRLLNAADFGQHTRRIRYFAIFAKGDLPIVFPEPTHAEHPEKVKLLDGQVLKKWRPVIECLDLNDVGRSVFNRKKKLADKTLIRLRKGVIKFDGDKRLLMHCNSPGYCSPTDVPCTTLTKKGHKYVINPSLLKYYGTGTVQGTDRPADTLTKKDRFAAVFPSVMRYFGGAGGVVYSAMKPAYTLTKKDRMALIMQYQGNSECRGVHEPLNTITKKDKYACFRPSFIHGAFGEPETNPRNTSLLKPAPTICRQQRRQVVFTQRVAPFVFRQFSGGGWYSPAHKPVGAMQKVPKMDLVQPWIDNNRFDQAGQSVNRPSPTLTTAKKFYVQAWIDNNRFENNGNSLNRPIPTLVAKGAKYLVQGWLVDNQFDNSGCSLALPMPTILRSRRHYCLASAFVTNAQYSNNGNSVHRPAPTIIASQKSYPLGLAVATYDGTPVQDKPGDSVEMLKLKALCREKGIVDITMRMLKVGELKAIQGFGRDYKLFGTITKQKAFIGQSVCPLVPQRWAEAKHAALLEWLANNDLPTGPLKKVDDHWFEEVYVNSATVTGLAVSDKLVEARSNNAIQKMMFDDDTMLQMAAKTVAA